MTNRENVIKRLEECLSASCRGFRTCPYSDDPEWDAVEAALAILREHEAMEQCLKTKCVVCPHCANCDVDENGLLKEQEPVEPDGDNCGECGYTVHRINYDGPNKGLRHEWFRFCPSCGKAVQWSE